VTKRLVLIHTVPPLVEVFTRLVKDLLPGVEVYHVLDEPMLEQARRASGKGARPVNILRRLQAHVTAAEDIDACAVLVTCSTISPYLDEIRSNIPVIKIDETMLTQAVEQASVIGVLATNPTTLEPTCLALEKKARQMGKPIEIHPVVVEGAFSAWVAGDNLMHDRLVLQAIREMSAGLDLIVLAQASMARVLEATQDSSLPVPVLSSPHTALVRIKEIINGGDR
jgi:aspartate/glutamate racemase